MTFEETCDRIEAEILPALIAEAKATKTEINRYGLRITKGGGIYDGTRRISKAGAVGIVAFSMRPATGWSR